MEQFSSFQAAMQALNPYSDISPSSEDLAKQRRQYLKSRWKHLHGGDTAENDGNFKRLMQQAAITTATTILGDSEPPLSISHVYHAWRAEKALWPSIHSGGFPTPVGPPRDGLPISKIYYRVYVALMKKRPDLTPPIIPEDLVDSTTTAPPMANAANSNLIYTAAGVPFAPLAQYHYSPEPPLQATLPWGQSHFPNASLEGIHVSTPSNLPYLPQSSALQHTSAAAGTTQGISQHTLAFPTQHPTQSHPPAFSTRRRRRLSDSTVAGVGGPRIGAWGKPLGIFKKAQKNPPKRSVDMPKPYSQVKAAPKHSQRSRQIQTRGAEVVPPNPFGITGPTVHTSQQMPQTGYVQIQSRPRMAEVVPPNPFGITGPTGRTSQQMPQASYGQAQPQYAQQQPLPFNQSYRFPASQQNYVASPPPVQAQAPPSTYPYVVPHQQQQAPGQNYTQLDQYGPSSPAPQQYPAIWFGGVGHALHNAPQTYGSVSQPFSSVSHPFGDAPHPYGGAPQPLSSQMAYPAPQRLVNFSDFAGHDDDDDESSDAKTSFFVGDAVFKDEVLQKGNVILQHGPANMGPWRSQFEKRLKRVYLLCFSRPPTLLSKPPKSQESDQEHFLWEGSLGWLFVSGSPKQEVKDSWEQNSARLLAICYG
ncbi:hypothetical protein AB5N19_02199 [Seiridium cardinale]